MADFFSGLAQGLQGLPDEIGKLQEYARAKKAATALANSDFSGVGGNAPPAPPAAALAALAPKPQPTAPMPSTAPQAAPRDPLAPLPSPGGAPAPPMPSTAPQGAPQAPPQPDPALSATAQPGINFDNPIREANQTWSSIITSIKRANPKIDPMTLMTAAKEQLDNIKGIAPITKSIMDAQMKGNEFLITTQLKMQRLRQLGQEVEIKLANAQTNAEKNQIISDWHKGQLAIEQGRAETYAESVDYQHEDRQSAESGRNTRNTQNVQSREGIAQGRNETNLDIAGGRSRDSRYRTEQGFRGAQVRSGGQAGPEPSREGLGLPPDARKAPDGNYYVKRGGKYFRVEP